MENRMEAVQGDITKMKVDTIVNAANSSLLGGGGVDGAIHRAAGPELVAMCHARRLRDRQGEDHARLPTARQPGSIPSARSGTAAHTRGHAPRRLLSQFSAHRRGAGLKTIAFPAIGTGVYRFPSERACRNAMDAVREFLAEHPAVEKVSFVCFDSLTLGFYKKAVA